MPTLALTDFADGLEKNDTARRSARESGKAIVWPSPETVGIASMTFGLQLTYSPILYPCLPGITCIRQATLFVHLRKAVAMNGDALKVDSVREIFESFSVWLPDYNNDMMSLHDAENQTPKVKQLVRANSVFDPARADALVQLSSPEPPTPAATKPDATVKAAQAALADQQEKDLNEKIALIEMHHASGSTDIVPTEDLDGRLQMRLSLWRSQARKMPIASPRMQSLPPASALQGRSRQLVAALTSLGECQLISRHATTGMSVLCPQRQRS
ncbi:unnamed protein product [Symbiodinium sp. CCMP2592]|nr:unnamed protein product [Symbiodinium sp. CCMP2592]